MKLKCTRGRLLNYGFQCFLVAVWFGLTGVKIRHFLSEPTAFRSKHDHEFKIPLITVTSLRPLPKHVTEIIKDGTDEERSELFANQTLFDFIQSYRLSLAEISGVTNVTENERRQRRNETMLKDSFGNAWQRFVRLDMELASTVTLKHPWLMLRLPRKWEKEFGISESRYLYEVLFHSNPDILNYPGLNAYLLLRNASQHRDVKVAIERTVYMNLKRSPCEEDPKYYTASCQRSCFLKHVNCSISSTEKGETDGKPACMASDYSWYANKTAAFFWRSNAQVSKCDCRQPCVRDRTSYTLLSDVTESTNDSVKVWIEMETLGRVNVEVLTYGIEDLLADIGGYLGLLLGVSLLSLCGASRRLAKRLAKRALRRRKGQQTDAEEDPGDGAGLEKGECEHCHKS